jgi:hypothetical protein
MSRSKELETSTERASRRRARSVGTLALVGLTVGLAPAVAAQTQRQPITQSAEDARWYPWVGCWQRSGEVGAPARFTCVRAGTGASADILTIANGAIESREHLTVDALPHPIDTDGCRGSQTASWAASGNRIYIGAAYSCSGSLQGRSTRMFAILPSGVWLEIRAVHSGGGWVETITRFHDAGLPTSIPADLRSEISHRELAVATARAAASAPVSAADIAEASRAVDSVIVQSWLAARGQAFASESVGGSAAPNVQVYRGSPANVPQQQQMANTNPPPLEPGCDPFGCYAPNAYSEYNGYAFTPYASPYGYGAPYFWPYVSSAVVIRGGSRGPLRGFPSGGRPGVLHTPGNHGPVGHSPLGHSPIGGAPVGGRPVNHQPSGQVPRGGMPGRIRP